MEMWFCYGFCFRASPKVDDMIMALRMGSIVFEAMLASAITFCIISCLGEMNQITSRAKEEK